MKQEVRLGSGFLVAVLTLTFGSAGQNAPVQGPGSPLAPLRYEEPKHLTGTIYAQGRGEHKVLFQFQREATRSGSTLRVRRDFTYTNGTLAAREQVVYEGDALVSYELEETQIGAGGSARVRRGPSGTERGQIDFTYTHEDGARPKTRSETLAPDTLVDDMVGPFLASHWEALQRGQEVKCRYLVIPRRETVGFTFKKDSESRWRGRDVLIVKMAPSSAFIAALVEPLFFTIEKAPPHRVLRYVGRTTPKAHVGNKWKDLDAVTVFDWDSIPQRNR